MLLEEVFECVWHRCPDDAADVAIVVAMNGHVRESGVILFICYFTCTDVPARAIVALSASAIIRVPEAYWSALVQLFEKCRWNASGMMSHGSVEVLRASVPSEESELTPRESYTLGWP